MSKQRAWLLIHRLGCRVQFIHVKTRYPEVSQDPGEAARINNCWPLLLFWKEKQHQPMPCLTYGSQSCLGHAESREEGSCTHMKPWGLFWLPIVEEKLKLSHDAILELPEGEHMAAPIIGHWLQEVYLPWQRLPGSWAFLESVHSLER